MTRQERELAQELLSRSQNFESAVQNADAPPLRNSRTGKLVPQKGNPSFTAQFTLSFLLLFFSVNAGAYTNRSAAYMLANAPTLANNTIPAFIFGNSDFSSGFTKMQALYPLTLWTYGAPLTIGKDYLQVNDVALDATAKSYLQNGDIVTPVYATSGGVNYVALSVTRCVEVAYSTFLGSISSDMFSLNGIRYNISDDNLINQYKNAIGIYRQSLFGKLESDSLNPNTYKMPENYQKGVIDIPLQEKIDKNSFLAFRMNYTAAETLSWNIFVRSLERLV